MILLVFSIVTNYLIGFGISKSNSKTQRRFYVALSVVVALSILSYFKYTYFFTSLFNEILGTHYRVINYLNIWANGLFNLKLDITSIFLPAGISFFSFQALSYTIDLYRKQTKPVKNIIDFGFYLSFFPQLVAGPIVRASEFIPQMYTRYVLSNREASHAMFLIASGLVKKMVISNFISLNFVDRVFDSPLSYTGFENLMGVYGYALQIYCDFSGYTDIAIGLALLLGFRIPVNFNSPYKAVNLSDFWRRWHISLSSWLRDYLYIPLGGNRKGNVRTYVNLLITMLLGGLWHGANLRFVIWGGIHGVGLAIHKGWSAMFPARRDIQKFRILHWLLTFQVVSLAWIFFRASDLTVAAQVISQILYHFNAHLIPDIIAGYSNVFIIIAAGFVIHWLPSRLKEKARGLFIVTPVYVKIAFAVFLIIFVYQFKSSVLQPFIYFQF